VPVKTVKLAAFLVAGLFAALAGLTLAAQTLTTPGGEIIAFEVDAFRKHRLLNGLDDGSFDLLLYPLPVKGVDLVSTRLFREPLWIVTPSDHPLAGKDTVTHSDLKGETVLTLETGHRLHDQVRDLCDQFGAHLSLAFEGTSLDTLRQMVGMGMGLSFLPALYVRSEVSNDRQVVARALRTRGPYRNIGMIWRRHSARQVEFLALASLIRTVLKRNVSEVTVIE